MNCYSIENLKEESPLTDLTDRMRTRCGKDEENFYPSDPGIPSPSPRIVVIVGIVISVKRVLAKLQVYLEII